MKKAWCWAALAAAWGAGMAAWAQGAPAAAARDALKEEIADLRRRPAVCALPPYLPEGADFDAACRKAGEGGRKVLVSIGREACGRCQRFYELVRRGAVRLDTNAVAFVRLDIDDPGQREYFLGTFEPPDSRLPFVGVTDAARTEIRPCLSGAPSAAAYQKLLDAK